MRSFCVFLILATAVAGLADTLYLKYGKVVGGTYLGGTARQVRMDLGDRVSSYDIADVARIEFQSAAAAAPAPSSKEREETRERPRLVRADPDSTRPQSASTSSLTIPSGTVLKVRMIDGVDSETSQLGQTFQASLDDPIMIDGQTVVPRGADIV